MLWGLKSQGLSCQIGHSGQPCHCSPRGGIQSANLNNLILRYVVLQSLETGWLPGKLALLPTTASHSSHFYQLLADEDIKTSLAQRAQL
jgi:hypothetical protein